MMEEGEEEQADPDDVFSQYCGFAMEEGKEEADAEDTIAEDDDALGDVIRDAQRDCKSEKEKTKFDQMLQVLGILNTNRKIRKHTDTDVAFTREYSRVSIFHRECECTN